MRFLDVDSPLMQILGKVADLMWLNILAMVCCIPIVTTGASLTAMHYMALKIVRNEECYITRGFFKSFKENFKQGTIIWLIFLLIALLLGGDYIIMKDSGLEFHNVLKIVLTVVTVLAVMTFMCVFPLLARFENTVFNTIKNAFFMSILQLPKTIAMIVLAFFPLLLIAVSYRLVPIAILFGMSIPAYLSAMMYNKFFKKLEIQIAEAAAANGEVPPEESEDEKIFHDHVDENISIDDNKR